MKFAYIAVAIALAFATVGESRPRFNLNNKIKMCGKPLVNIIDDICKAYENDTVAVAREYNSFSFSRVVATMANMSSVFSVSANRMYAQQPFMATICCLMYCTVRDIVNQCRPLG